MVRVKICGITSVEDALQAVEAGADALGFVFHDKSPRSVFPEQAAMIVRALPPFVQAVGLFVNAEIDFVNATAELCRLDLVQLHGEESPEYCGLMVRRVIKAFRVKDVTSLDLMCNYRVAGYLLDAWSPDGLRRHRDNLQLGDREACREIWSDHPCRRVDPAQCPHGGGGGGPVRGGCIERSGICAR